MSLFVKKYSKYLLISFCTLFLFFDGKAQSILAEGDVYRMEINTNGIYRFGFDELNPILNGKNPNLLSFSSTRGFHLGEELVDPLQSYLKECHVLSVGMEDGVLNQADYVLVYLESNEGTLYENERWIYKNNIYSTQNYLFITVSESNNLKKISPLDPPESINEISNAQIIEHFEVDQINILKESFDRREYGSGQEWYRKPINGSSSIDLSSNFQFQNFVPNQQIEASIAFAARSSSTSLGKLAIDNYSMDFSFPSLATNDNLSTYARRKETSETFSQSGKPQRVIVTYTASNSEARGWLDWVEIRYLSRITSQEKSQIYFLPSSSETATLDINNLNSQTHVWDISDPFHPVNCKNSDIFYGPASEIGSKIIVFEDDNVLVPSAIEKIENQDVLSHEDVQYFIIYPKEFSAAASLLKKHRESLDPDLKVEAVSANQIYNEFGSGKADPSALRNFLAYHYNKDQTLESVLMMGDGTFDCRYIYDDLPKQNFIPVYQTRSSLNPINSYPSDDYYGLLNIGEGGSLRGALDIAVGRLPVKSPQEALSSTKKIMEYENSVSDDSNWTSKIAFVADDEDNNLHLNSAERIANSFTSEHQQYTSKKIYTDAYAQEYTTSGETNPLSTEAINETINDGVLAMCYLGHGGSEGWADERILEKTDISSWNNKHKLPLLITATCSFAGYDKPSNLSAGEMVLLKEDGGCIALLTTVRVVTAQDNERLTNAVFEQLLTIEDNQVIPIGEVLRRAKNSNRSDTLQSNARKFTLLGDPMMRLKVPTYSVEIEEITNGKNQIADTLKALDFITIKGVIKKPNGSLASEFSGTLEIELLDKATQLRTLGQDPKSRIQDFEVQNQALFTGFTEIEKGNFTIKFYLPKDINYRFGEGKIVLTSLYKNHLALGAKNVIIGGTSSDILDDNSGPTIDISLQNAVGPNNKSNSNPIFDIVLEDISGINVSSSAIGHDITAEIDGNSKDKLILNKQFKTIENSYTKGTIELQLSNLNEGNHTLSVKAWDSYNNVSTSQIAFEVITNQSNQTFNVMAYPNPYQGYVTLEFQNPIGLDPYQYDLFIFDNNGKQVYHSSGENQNGSSSSSIYLSSSDMPEMLHSSDNVYFAKIIVSSLNKKQTNNIKTGTVTISIIKN